MIATFVACEWWLFFSLRKVFGLFLGGALLCGVILWAYFLHICRV